MAHRSPNRIEHTLKGLVTPRGPAIALGYEGLNDHLTLRRGPLLAAVAGKRETKERPPAAPATIRRLELSRPDLAGRDRYCRIGLGPNSVDDLLVDLSIEACSEPPAEVVLDADATDDPIHSRQQVTFFHGYYVSYCYMPLNISAAERIWCAPLRTADRDGAADSLEEPERIVPRIRAA